MTAPAPADLLVVGRIVVAALPTGLETADALGIRDGRVVAVGRREDIAVAAGARVIDAGPAAVVPGIHDFHLHLAVMARAREEIGLDDARDIVEIAECVRAASAGRRPDEWVTGRGWTDAQLRGPAVRLLEEAVDGRPAFLTSHDGHSAWASAAARRLAGLGPAAADPDGGRIERDPDGEPTGILRERALDLVAPLVVRLRGAALRGPLDATLRAMARLGITGATDAGDYTAASGTGVDAAFGDSFSTLSDLADGLDGRLRLTLDIPADALPAAAERGLRSGARLDGRGTMRFGWAKQYADGTLGSGTAALFEAGPCSGDEPGIMRVSDERLDLDFGTARRAGIGLAVHAIGDRAVAAVLDAAERAASPAPGVPPDRVEHVQLVRHSDAARFARRGIIASVQPVHAASDRELVERCWPSRQHEAYAWRALLDAGALLASGSDAPIESVNPWLGMFAAVHRRPPGDTGEDWLPEQAMTPLEALASYTTAPAMAIGAVDEGQLRPGARADLAVLNVGLDVLAAADERLADVVADVTLVDGREVPR